MSIRNGFLLSLGILAGFASISVPATADDSSLVATVLQDEPRKIPEDNTAYFSRADRKVRFQLVKLSGQGNEMLASTNVKVIGPSGEQADLVADANGVATLEMAKPGLHVLGIAGDNGHAAIPIALREEAEDVGVTPPSVKLPLVDIDPSEVVRLTSSYLPPDLSGAFEDIDSDLVSTGEVAQGLQYRVRLGEDGTMLGQVYSVVRDGLTGYGVEGTNILIYRGNVLVARATADQFGRFTVAEMVPGIYGLVGAGPAGYAAFGFEAYNAAAVASVGQSETTLVSKVNADKELITANNAQAKGSVLPVVLVPPSMVPGVVEQIRLAGGFIGDGIASPVGAPAGAFGTPPAGGGFGGGPGGFSGGGGGFAGGAGVGGGGGLLGLAAVGGIAAAAIAASDDGNENNQPIISSPSRP